MYPIEREDYINAYIAAISEEIRQSRRSRQAARGPSDATGRFHRAVVRLPHREAVGRSRTTEPAPDRLTHGRRLVGFAGSPCSATSS